MSDALLHAHGSPVVRAAMRSTADDFSVEELPAFEASGVGEHLLLTIEKRNTNTAYAAQRLAEWAGVGEAAIGYAGLKDRHAVTRQRFTVHLPKRAAPDLAALESDTLHVVDHAWHARKLPRGALAGNRFVLVLRDVCAATHDAHGTNGAHDEAGASLADTDDTTGLHQAVETRLRAIAARGVPNYFGEQRFGRGGDNVANALAMFAQAAALAERDAAREAQGGGGGKRRRLPRDQRTFLLSAARSQLFNQVLSARVADGSWDKGLDGEVWMLDGSRSVFGPEPFNDELARRLAEFDIHPSGPLWGRGDVRAADAALAVEQDAMRDARSMALQAGLEAAGLKQERRSLRLRAGGLAWSWLDARTLQLRFDLQPGAYATTVLAELGAMHDASHRHSDRD